MLYEFVTYAHGGLVFAAVIVAALAAWAVFAPDDFREKVSLTGSVFRDSLRGLADEFGPVLATTTGRNSALLAVTGFFGTVMPEAMANSGARAVVFALLVYYLLRTWIGRKRATGPILTPNDLRAFNAPTSETYPAYATAKTATENVGGTYLPANHDALLHGVGLNPQVTITHIIDQAAPEVEKPKKPRARARVNAQAAKRRAAR